MSEIIDIVEQLDFSTNSVTSHYDGIKRHTEIQEDLKQKLEQVFVDKIQKSNSIFNGYEKRGIYHKWFSEFLCLTMEFYFSKHFNNIFYIKIYYTKINDKYVKDVLYYNSEYKTLLLNGNCDRLQINVDSNKALELCAKFVSKIKDDCFISDKVIKNFSITDMDIL